MSNRKKVLFISNICKGITNYHLVPFKVCQSLGYEFHLAANFSEMPNNEQEMYSDIQFHQIDLKRFPFHPQNVKAYLQLRDVIKKEKIDIIHCNTPIGGLLGRLCGKFCRVDKVLYTAHGFHFFKGAPLKNWIIYYNVERLLAHWTDAILTMNQEDFKNAQKFKLRNNGHVFYIPGVGIDTEMYKDVKVDCNELRKSFGIKDSDIVCISMGDLIPRKNYEAAIKAVALCKNKNIHYLICGDGPELENLMAISENCGIKERVHFLGFRRDVKKLIQIADLFLFTSLQEGLPRSLMEAMAAGLPVICSRIRGNVDLVDDDVGGILVDPLNVREIADALNIIPDMDLKSMGSHNLDKIKDYSVDNVISEEINIYKQCTKIKSSSEEIFLESKET